MNINGDYSDARGYLNIIIGSGEERRGFYMLCNSDPHIRSTVAVFNSCCIQL